MIPADTSPTVCVVGSVNLDLVVYGSQLPSPGETVVGGTFAQFPGGKGANQALAAQRLGARVSLVAAVGNDTMAATALHRLEAADVDLSSVVVVDDAATGVALILVDDGGENMISVASGANHRLQVSTIPPADVTLCQLEVKDGPLVAAARTATGLFVVNAAPARPLPASVAARADVIIVNETENTQLADQLAQCRAIRVVTLGRHGAAAYHQDREIARCAGYAVDAVDTVGAGDAFVGALVTAIASAPPPARSYLNDRIAPALEFACLAGALATTKPGAQSASPTRAELESLSPRIRRASA